jgi:hypothetical protein
LAKWHPARPPFFDDSWKLAERGDYAGAVRLLEYVVAGRTSILGVDHPNTARTRQLLERYGG